jgi:hypothetical protein
MKKVTAAVLLILTVLAYPASAEKSSSFVLPSGVRVRIVEDDFQRSLFKIEGCTADNSPCLINGRIPFGTAFTLPKTYVKSITITYQGRSYSLDASDMYDAWGARPLEYKGVIRYFGGKCFDKHNCQFRGLFSDAAGTFVAEWLIANGLSNRTILTSSNDVVNLFAKNIDPPEFE